MVGDLGGDLGGDRQGGGLGQGRGETASRESECADATRRIAEQIWNIRKIWNIWNRVTRRLHARMGVHLLWRHVEGISHEGYPSPSSRAQVESLEYTVRVRERFAERRDRGEIERA